VRGVGSTRPDGRGRPRYYPATAPVLDCYCPVLSRRLDFVTSCPDLAAPVRPPLVPCSLSPSICLRLDRCIHPFVRSGCGSSTITEQFKCTWMAGGSRQPDRRLHQRGAPASTEHQEPGPGAAKDAFASYSSRACARVGARACARARACVYVRACVCARVCWCGWVGVNGSQGVWVRVRAPIACSSRSPSSPCRRASSQQRRCRDSRLLRLASVVCSASSVKCWPCWTCSRGLGSSRPVRLRVSFLRHLSVHIPTAYTCCCLHAPDRRGERLLLLVPAEQHSSTHTSPSRSAAVTRRRA
jgi:hypothetical protein